MDPEQLKAHDPSGSTAGAVLFVEDEQELRAAVSTLLRREGFHVVEAGDGIAGVELFGVHEAQIDVILLDMTLPRMSGREVLEAVCRIRPDVKVIITSAYSQETFTLTGTQKHWGYIRKPYRISELVNLLRKACERTAR